MFVVRRVAVVEAGFGGDSEWYRPTRAKGRKVVSRSG